MVDPIRVAVASDENYAIPLAACVRSIIDNANPGGAVEVAVLSCGISDTSREALISSWDSDTAKIEWVEVDQSALADLPTDSTLISRLPTATYVRLLLPDVVPADWRRAVFLDTDTITCGSLVDLWEVPLGSRPFAAAQDPYTPVVSHDHGIPFWSEAGFHADTPYFNAGVLLIDLDRWRADDITAKAVDYVLANREVIRMADQEALNVVARGDFPVLDPRWNAMNYWFHVKTEAAVRAAGRIDVRERTGIRHYNGADKPWTNTGYYAARGMDVAPFFHHLDRTAWSSWRPDAW